MTLHGTAENKAFCNNCIAVAFATALLFLSRSAFAYRPFDGTDADVAKEGSFELELGPAHYLRQDGMSYVLAPATVLNFGIFHGAELVVDSKIGSRTSIYQGSLGINSMIKTCW